MSGGAFERGLAAAWSAWHSRHGGKLGPGPISRSDDTFTAGYSAALRDAAGHVRTRAELARRAGYWGDFDRALLDAASAIEALPVKEG